MFTSRYWRAVEYTLIGLAALVGLVQIVWQLGRPARR
jgi:hypothetical protein